MLFNLFQNGSDDDVNFFKIDMQAFNFGSEGDQLSFNRYESADCDGGAPTLVDDDITVRSRWGFTRAFYRSYLDDINMCDFGGSISLNDSEGM